MTGHRQGPNRPHRIAVGRGAVRHHAAQEEAARGDGDGGGAATGKRIARGGGTPRTADTTTAAQPAQDAVVGLVGEATRGGDDVRRRGWFWHWNSIVTQYAPLIGLKGVGLLNSYTVWTDRREESPHRGYAFPSQQREADFYGEDRAELITINKLLVALDLIEIRKEMVIRPDEHGRRWRVPHNFYRVKDHDDGFSLTTRAVLRVAELADRDKAVYRYVRRVFSPRFAPIDADNVWHRILPEVRRTDLWQRLGARTAREEEAASARTRAGHAARRGDAAASSAQPAPAPAPSRRAAGDGAFFVPCGDDTAAPNDSGGDSAPGAKAGGGATAVAGANNGSGVGVARTNDGPPPDVAGSNDALAPIAPTSVDPANTGRPTAVAPANTTYNESVLTTSTTTRDESGRRGGEESRSRGGAEARSKDVADATVGRDVPTPLPATPRPLDASTPDEAAALRAFQEANDRRVTAAQRKLLREMAAAHDTAAHASGRTGWELVRAAIAEAVETSRGSGIAPAYLRAILERWGREGVAQARPRGGERSRNRREQIAERVPQAVPAARASGLPPAGIRPAVRPRPGEMDAASDDPAAPASTARRVGPATPVPFLVPECGLPSGQVWAAVLEELRHGGGVSPANFDAWLRATTLLGRDASGALVVGVPHALAQRRVAARFLAPLRAAVAAVAGAALPVEIVVSEEWLGATGDEGVAAPESAPADAKRGA